MMNLEDRCRIEHICMRLCHDFGYYMDYSDYPALVNLFAADAEWTRHGETLRGREAMQAAMKGRPADRFARHVTTNIHFLEVSAERAKAVVLNISFFAKHLGDPPAALVAGQHMLLEFRDEYAVTAEGWRI
jgi:hypothetical protein